MNEGLIPRRYAKALYKYAKEQQKAHEVYQQMKQLDASYGELPTLKTTVDNPYLPAKDKEKVLKTASGNLETEIVTRFFKLVIRNNRENLMRNIAIAYQQIYREENSMERVTITTATPLSESEYEKIKAIVQAHEKGMTLEYVIAVNPDIIGGFTIQVETRQLDASIKNELKKLRLKLLS